MNSKNTRFQIFVLIASWLALPAVTQAQYLFTTNNGAITITQYTGGGGAVTIPDKIDGFPVTTIASDAFLPNYNLDSITIGTNVTTIEANAFFQCFNLTSVSIPASVTNIGAGPFYDCQNLTTISVAAANSYFTNVNQLLFNKTLTSLIQFPTGIGGSYVLPAAVTNIGEAFVGNILTAISVAQGNLYFTNVSGVLFSKDQTVLVSYPGGLSGSYTIPNTVTTIAASAFEYSPSVASVSIGTNVTSIGYAAFFDCASLTAITVNPTNSFYSSTNGVLFDKNKTLLIQYPIAVSGSYVIPATVENLADGAFGDAFGLTSVVIPNSVTNIGFETFYSCQSLAGVSLGNHIINITADAFYYCPDLTSLVIPASVTSIGAYAFGDCQSLDSVCFEGKPPIDGGGIFYYDFSLGSILYINGTSGWGSTYDGIATAPCASCGTSLPVLAIQRSGANVILTWSTDFSTFTLQSTTNLPTNWNTVTPAPSVIAGMETVTTPITGTRKFFRLSQ